MTANEDMSIEKTDFVFDLKVSEEEIVNTSQMAMDHLNKLYTKFRDSRWSHHEDYDITTAVWMHTTLKLARVATRSNLFILTSGYYKTLWTTSNYGRILHGVQEVGMKKAVPNDSLYVVNSDCTQKCVIISVTYNLSLPTCTVHNAKTLPRAIYDVT
jgi:hypothetical protein